MFFNILKLQSFFIYKLSFIMETQANIIGKVTIINGRKAKIISTSGDEVTAVFQENWKYKKWNETIITLKSWISLLDERKYQENTDEIENKEINNQRYFEMIRDCSNKWTEELKKIGIKKISIGEKYDSTGLDMITNKSIEIKKIHDDIFKHFLENQNYELSNNQMNNAFNYAAIQLGILNVDRLPNFTRNEAVKYVKAIKNSRYREVEVTFESKLKLTFPHFNANNIKEWDYFKIIYSDPQFTKELEITLCDSWGMRKASWVSQEYVDNDNSDKNALVIIEK